jgi:hypothetical protein
MSDSAIPEDVGELEMIHGTRAVLEMLAGKWNVEVLYLLATGTRRYNQVLYEVGEISKEDADAYAALARARRPCRAPGVR